MTTYQLQAGSVLDSVKSQILKHHIASEEEIKSLLQSLSYFSIEVSPSFALDVNNPKSEATQIYRVAENIVSRGLPTRPSLSTEKHISELLTNTVGIEILQDRTAERIGSIKYEIQGDKEFANLLWRALHIIDADAGFVEPSTPPRSNFPIYASKEEKAFIEFGLPKIAPEYLTQLLESERSIESIICTTQDIPNQSTENTTEEFTRQRVDFCLEIPYTSDGSNRGYVFEVDGAQHNETNNNMIDAKRNRALEEAGFKTLRIPASSVNNPEVYLVTLYNALQQEDGYFSILKNNIENPLRETQLGQVAMMAALTPIAISRVLKALFRFVNSGKLDLEASAWHIAIIERDIPCAELAFSDFRRLIGQLAMLSGQMDLPTITVERFSDKHPYEKTQKTSNTFDLCIDISVLSRDFSNSLCANIPAKNHCTIRSSRSINSRRTFLFAPNIEYKSLGKTILIDDEEVFVEDSKLTDCLKALLVDLFRKTDFRPGQIQVLDRALRNKNVIGLLPTGHGKSLTYQLAAMLQPGVCAVIDPLKSLMRDQDRCLRDNQIDGSLFINSSLSTLERQRAIKMLASGEVLFVFLAPERLQSQEFRKTLLSSSLEQAISFSYCVIDEAHCVSEWGHDFRTSYLRVGINARRFCKSWQRREVPILALTATASYDVLADIQRELDVEGNDSVVTLKENEMRRNELNYRVVEIPVLSEHQANGNPLNMWGIYAAVSEQKVFTLKTILKSIDLEEEPTIVFCPHKKGNFGVEDIESKINSDEQLCNWSSGVFTGSNNINFEEAKNHELVNQQTQDSFIGGTIDILFATKAFGMGIDKPDIRNIFHFNYPSSIESYYQEAGRAGRDKKSSTCTILYCNQTFDQIRQNESITLDASLMLSFHENSFKGVEFEKRWLYELLSEIHPPKTNREDRAAQAIKAELQERSIAIENCRYYSRNNKRQIYLNPDMGFFDLTTPSFIYTPSSRSTLSTETVNTLQGILQDVFFGEFSEDEYCFGIESMLSEMTIGSERSISIPFENDAADEIAQALKNDHPTNNLISRNLVLKSSHYCKTPEDFISNLEKEIRKTCDNIDLFLSPYTKNLAKKRFFGIRDREATMKSVYRLMSVGVISDYTVDYLEHKIICTINKISDNEYKNATASYLKKYYADERVEGIMATLDIRPGVTIIQKCLNLIIDFTYNEIAKQRRSAIDEMERACRYGIEHPDSNSFEDYIMMYMNSKYARHQYLPADTNNGNIEDINIVNKYIEIISRDSGGEINNLKHLRGAAALMHAQRPDNYVFLLLDAFATCILEKGRESMISKAIGKLLEGFDRYGRKNKLTIEELDDQINMFADKIAQFDEMAAVPIRGTRGLLIHKRHLDWLKHYREERFIC